MGIFSESTLFSTSNLIYIISSAVKFHDGILLHEPHRFFLLGGWRPCL